MSLVDLGKRLLDSAKHGETEQVRQLMTSGAPFTTDWLGTSPLHMAAQYGHLATAEVLLRAGISRDARTKVDRTPLHIAGQEGHLEIVELLIRHGADIEAKDMLKMTPLHWAVERGHLSVIHTLLQHGANVNVYSKFDKTPVDIAIDSNREDLVQLLQEYVNKPKIKEEIKSSCAGSTKVVSTNDEKTTIAKMVNTTSVSCTQQTSITLSSPVLTLGKGSRPILLHANLANLQKATAAGVTALGNTPKTEVEEDEGSDQSSTSVLATLAALAEATASNTTGSATEALQWLETNGITMFPSDNSTLINSAIEGGQTISLTEAGKLALTWVKEQQQNLMKTSTVPPATISALGSNGVQNLTTNGNQKVITIVADQSQLPTIITSTSPPVTGAQIRANSEVNCTESPAKRLKKNPVQTPIKVYGRTGSVNNSAIEREKEKLQRELDEARRQAEKYKTQLQQKEHEAELYRKQLEEIRTAK